MFNRLIFMAWLIVLSTVTNSFAGKGGGDAYAFLKAGVGARAMAMGGAFVALAEDGDAAYWNPAGLGLMSEEKGKRGIDISSAFGSNEEIGRKYYYLGYTSSVNILKKNREGMGIGLISMTVGGIERWQPSSQGGFPIPQGSFDDAERAIIIAYGNEILPGLFCVGSNLKIITHNMDNHSASGIGVDIGLLADISAIFYRKERAILGILEGVKAGMVVRNNLGKKWDSGHIDDGMLSGELGMTGNILWKNKQMGRLNLTLSQEKGRTMSLSSGVEIDVLKNISIRGGINRWYLEARESGLDAERLNYGQRLCAGIGYKFRKTQIDYALALGRLETQHQMSAKIGF
ncbi:hypothetical protein KKE26_12510 [bacterium]|nr:hypothetical protein [bacterium]